MATKTYLEGWLVFAQKMSLPVATDGGTAMQEMWELRLGEKETGNTLHFLMTPEVRNLLVSQLTGGIVLAGGQLPNL